MNKYEKMDEYYQECIKHNMNIAKPGWFVSKKEAATLASWLDLHLKYNREDCQEFIEWQKWKRGQELTPRQRMLKELGIKEND